MVCVAIIFYFNRKYKRFYWFSYKSRSFWLARLAEISLITALRGKISQITLSRISKITSDQLDHRCRVSFLIIIITLSRSANIVCFCDVALGIFYLVVSFGFIFIAYGFAFQKSQKPIRLICFRGFCSFFVVGQVGLSYPSKSGAINK